MQPPTVREVIARLAREGWKHVRTDGDHRAFRKEGHVVIVAGRLGEHLDRGTYASIQRQAKWK